MLKTIHTMESHEASEAKALEVASELEAAKLGEAAKVVHEGYAETLTHTRFPHEHWRRIRTNNAIERLKREIRRRTRVVGTFPDGKTPSCSSPRGYNTWPRANGAPAATWT